MKLGIPLELEKIPWKPQEGSINLYYGPPRSGKTYGATSDAWDDVQKGELVYTTWPIHLPVFDDRLNFKYSLRNFLLIKRDYYKINAPKNLHYIDATTGQVDGVQTFDPNDPRAFIKYLNTLNHCKIYIDEAWRVIDSYKGSNFDIESRNLILVTGHQYRTVNLIAQRPTSIHVTARGNVNSFFKFRKIIKWPIIVFERCEYQDMLGETVDETADPVSRKIYFARRRIYEAYNTHFFGGLKPVHELDVEAFRLNLWERVKSLWYSIRPERTT